MKHFIIILLAAVAFAACTTRETTKETTIETVQEPVAPAPASVPAPEKNNKFEMELSDTGSSIKIKLP